MIKLAGFILQIVEFVSPKRAYKIAYWLFHKPFPPKYRESDIAFLASGEEKFIDTDKGPIYYHEWGEGKILLLVHGWSGKPSQYKRYINSLKICPTKL